MAAAGKVSAGHVELAHPLEAGRAAVRVGVHDHLGAAAQHVVGDRVHVADDHVGGVAGLDQRVGAAVDADQHRLVLVDVRPQDVEVVLVVVAAHHDQHVPAGDPGLHLGHADAVEQQVALLLEVVHRVRRERLELHRQALAGVGHRGGHGVGVLPDPGGDRLAAEQHGVALDADQVALVQPRRRPPRRGRRPAATPFLISTSGPRLG